MAEQTNQELTREEQRVFEDLGNQLSAFRTTKTADGGDDADLCGTYRKVRPILKIAVPIIRKIPPIGGKIADAVEFLMTLADSFCPQD